MVENLLGEFLAARICHITTEPVGVETGFIHTDEADGREVVGKRAEIILGVRIKACIEKPCNHFPLDIEAAGGNIHQFVETAIEVSLIGGEISNTRHVDGDDTD